MGYEYKMNYQTGMYICDKCGKEIKIAPVNHKKLDRNNGFGYWGNGQKYNYRGGKGALARHLKACYSK